MVSPWVSGSYELAGQSTSSIGMTTAWVVSNGSYMHPILYGLPFAAVSESQGPAAVPSVAPLAHRRPWPFFILGSSIGFGPCGIGCTGQVLTSSALLWGTATWSIFSSGLP